MYSNVTRLISEIIIAGADELAGSRDIFSVVVFALCRLPKITHTLSVRLASLGITGPKLRTPFNPSIR